MADSEDFNAEDSAEKAYAAAAEAVTEKELPEETAAPEESAAPVEFPAKPKRARKVAAPVTVAAEEPPIASVIEAPAAPRPRPARAAAKALKPTKAPKPVKAAAKLAVKRAAVKTATPAPVPAPVKATPINLRKPAVNKIKAAPKTVKPAPSATPKAAFIAQLKEIPMDVTASLKDAVSGAQDKAKEAFTKTSALAGEYGEFTKGNVEAFVESGKILASGLQDLGSKFVAESKSAFETMTSDVKELTSVKSPTDLFKLQTELLRRNLEGAIAYGSKTSEAMLKLTNDVIAPISGRVSLAVDKVRKAA